MAVKKLRLQRGWSQEQLSQFSGLSVRTIQRVEKGQSPSLESLKSLAAVFEVNVDELQIIPPLDPQISSRQPEKDIIEQVRHIKNFYSHLVTYLIFISILFGYNFATEPNHIWAVWPALGWGLAISRHAIKAFGFLDRCGKTWEKKQIDKRLKRNG